MDECQCHDQYAITRTTTVLVKRCRQCSLLHYYTVFPDGREEENADRKENDEPNACGALRDVPCQVCPDTPEPEMPV